MCMTIEEQIIALEHERDTLLTNTQNEYYHCASGKLQSTHANIKRKYNTKINNLRKYGVTNTSKCHDIKTKISQTRNKRRAELQQSYVKAVATRKARYGEHLEGYTHKIVATRKAKYGEHAELIVAKIQATKLERYGNAGYVNPQKTRKTNIERYGYANGNVAAQQATRELVYGKRGIGNYDKSVQTKLERYGNGLGCIDKMKSTKMQLYGNIWGDANKIMQTNIERYGVPWFCMTPQCRQANGRSVSNVNMWWHDMLFNRLGIDCNCDTLHIGRYVYDLHYENEHCKLLIEINPTFTHNSTYSFAYATGRSKHNYELPFDKHFSKTQLALKHGYICITIFDWFDVELVIDIVSKHLNGVHVDCTDFCLNPQLSTDTSSIMRHWYNCKTHKYIADSDDINESELVAHGYVAVYDCGHAKINDILS